MNETEKPLKDQASDSKPNIDKKSSADTKKSTDSKPDIDAKSSTDKKTSTDSKPDIDAKSSTDTKKSTDSKPDIDAKPSTDTKKSTDSKPDIDAKSSADSKKSTDSKPDIDAKSSTDAELKPSSDQTAQEKASKKNHGGLYFLLYLLMLIIAGISYIIWEEMQQLKTGLATITQQKQQLSAQINQFKARQTQHTDMLNTIQTEHTENIGKAEIKYLITIANQRLTLQNDIKTSIVALESADKAIQALADPRLLSVRQQLLADIAQLQTSAQVDITGLALTIANHVQNITQLPLNNNLQNTQVGTTSEQTTTTKHTEWWKKIPHILWQEIRKLIIISRTDTQHPTTMLPATINLLRQNLTLELLNARQAILNRDTENLHASIRLIRSWLAKYFDQQNSHVIQLDSTLRNIQNIELKPNPHNLNELLQKLQRTD